MGAWAYCRKCGWGIGPPSFREALQGEIECDCGEVRELDHWDKRQAFIELEERLDEVEKKLAELTKSG